MKCNAKFELRARRTCETCGGCGVVVHPYWELFWQEAPQKAPITHEYVCDWFSRHGFGPHEIPPEEVKCDLCDGSGYVETWIAVEELMPHRAIRGSYVA